MPELICVPASVTGTQNLEAVERLWRGGLSAENENGGEGRARDNRNAEPPGVACKNVLATTRRSGSVPPRLHLNAHQRNQFQKDRTHQLDK